MDPSPYIQADDFERKRTKAKIGRTQYVVVTSLKGIHLKYFHNFSVLMFLPCFFERILEISKCISYLRKVDTLANVSIIFGSILFTEYSFSTISLPFLPNISLKCLLSINTESFFIHSSDESA